MMQTVELPNGMRVRALNRIDPIVLYHEIFATGRCLLNGGPAVST